MTELVLVKTPGGALAPADEEARALVEKLKAGQGVRATIKRARNVRFHRKAFALFKLAFDVWEPETPQTYKGEAVSKDFDRFRKDMTILAGFYKAVYNARGEVRNDESRRARSINVMRSHDAHAGEAATEH